MGPLAWLLGAGVVGGGIYLVKHNQKTAASPSLASGSLSASASAPVPQVAAVATAPGSPPAALPASTPPVASNTGNSVVDDVVNFLNTADDVITNAAATGDFPVTAVVSTKDTGTAGQLRVRSTPSTSGKEVGTVAHGSLVEITGPAVQGDGTQAGGWAPVSQGSLTGFASMAFLDTDASAVQAAGGS